MPSAGDAGPAYVDRMPNELALQHLGSTSMGQGFPGCGGARVRLRVGLCDRGDKARAEG